jgi:beta-galactosidase GanA
MGRGGEMRVRSIKAMVIAAVLAASTTGLRAQEPSHPPLTTTSTHPIPRLVRQEGRYALMVDGAPYLILGAQSNNSSDWPAILPQVWPAIAYLHANTLETPIYWEQFEPRPGQFDYSEVNLLLAQARQQHVHLVLLWFGTWKNGSQHYMPEWMKLDSRHYFHVMNKEGEYVDSPSPFCTASLSEDKKAFAVLMSHLKQVDSERTVLMVQVENETGTWGTPRDYSPAANKLFEGPVPPEVLTVMGKSPDGPSASWETVFGPEAEVYFHAWAVAKYVGQVAAAGKAVYPLPMYVNAALHDPLTPETPVTYESGGPTDNVLPIWKAEAPAIDIETPDIYLPHTDQYLKTLEVYHRDNNALFIPETTGSQRSARFFFSALGLQAIGYSPFGLDYTRTSFPVSGENDSKNTFLEPTAQNYRLFAPMMREIARLNFEGKLQATAEPDDASSQLLHFGEWDALVTYQLRRRPTENSDTKHEPLGRALVAQLGPNQFLVTGMDCVVDFRPAGNSAQQKAGSIVAGTGQVPSARIDGTWMHRQFLRVEEGQYINGVFKFERILNGDQTDFGLRFPAAPEVLHVSLSTY